MTLRETEERERQVREREKGAGGPGLNCDLKIELLKEEVNTPL